MIIGSTSEPSTQISGPCNAELNWTWLLAPPETNELNQNILVLGHCNAKHNTTSLISYNVLITIICDSN